MCYHWQFPLKMEMTGVTLDSMSFQNLEPNQVEIPLGNHVGAFGARRKHDVHKGVDLYAPSGTKVYAVEDGIIVDVRWFTGVHANCDWWNDTMAVSVQGESGVVVYGEIMPVVKHGNQVKAGDFIGTVKTVLKIDKGRPMSMLHFALHHNGVLSNGRWYLDKAQPTGLIDPTNRLIKAVM